MIDIVFFTGVSGQTERFVRKLGDDFTVHQIPIRRTEDPLFVDRPYVLFTPTYGAGRDRRSVPPQVVKFLNNEENRSHIKAVVAGGNRNYGENYCRAGKVISEKCDVPLLGTFEIFGLPGEAEEIREALINIG